MGLVNIINFSELQWLSKQRVLKIVITIRRDGRSLYWKRTISNLLRRHRANVYSSLLRCMWAAEWPT